MAKNVVDVGKHRENLETDYDPFHMDHFKVGRTRVRPTLHLSHAPTNRVETGLDNRVRPTSEVGFDLVVK